MTRQAELHRIRADVVASIESLHGVLTALDEEIVAAELLRRVKAADRRPVLSIVDGHGTA